MMAHINSIHFETDDGEKVHVFLSDAMCYVNDEDPEPVLQVPVFAGKRTGTLRMTQQEIATLSRNLVIREATDWALKTRRKP